MRNTHGAAFAASPLLLPGALAVVATKHDKTSILADAL